VQEKQMQKKEAEWKIYWMLREKKSGNSKKI